VVLTAIKGSRKVIQWIFVVVAGQITTGIYFQVVPVYNDRKMLLIFVAIVIAFFLFILGGIRNKKFITAGIIVLSFITVMFLLGGSQKAPQGAGQTLQQVGQTVSSAAKSVLPKEKEPDVENTIQPQDKYVFFVKLKALQDFTIVGDGRFLILGDDVTYEAGKKYLRHADNDGDLYVQSLDGLATIKIYLH
jgi:hypothetical protein